MNKSNLMGGAVFISFYSSSFGFIAKENRGRNSNRSLETGTTGEATKRVLLTGLLLMAYSTCFLESTHYYQLQDGIATVTWILPHQSLIKNLVGHYLK